MKIIAYTDNFYSEYREHQDKEEYYVLCGKEFFPAPYKWASFHIWYSYATDEEGWVFQYCNAETEEQIRKYLSKESQINTIRIASSLDEVDDIKLLRDLMKMPFIEDHSRWLDYFSKAHTKNGNGVHKVIGDY